MINIGSRNASRKTLWRKDLEGLQSLPVRGRGLKHLSIRELRQLPEVAPRAGAWIETVLISSQVT